MAELLGIILHLAHHYAKCLLQHTSTYINLLYIRLNIQKYKVHGLVYRKIFAAVKLCSFVDSSNLASPPSGTCGHAPKIMGVGGVASA